LRHPTIASVLHRLLPLAALCALVAPVAAQQPTQAQRNAIRQSCASDYQAQCSGVPSGGMASLQCLQQHMASLSPACQSAVGAASGAGGASGGMGAAPGSGMGGAAMGGPGMGGGMGNGMGGGMMHGGAPPAMSPREEIGLMRMECRQDFRTLCSNVPMGGGRAMACLERNGTRLSPGCRNALAEFHASH
jgi:hypothetical protein